MKLPHGQTRVLVLGTHAFAEEVDDLIDEISHLETAGFVENLDRSRCDLLIHGKPVHWVTELDRLPPEHALVCAIGTTQRWRFIDQVSPYARSFVSIVHPTARVSPRSRLGEGTIVSAGVIVGTATDIGAHTILNRGVLVGHHTRIGRGVTVSPGANIAGKCTIGDGSYIGMGAIILDGVTIGAGAVVGAGSLVTRNVPANVLVYGSPAKVQRTGVDGR